MASSYIGFMIQWGFVYVAYAINTALTYSLEIEALLHSAVDIGNDVKTVLVYRQNDVTIDSYQAELLWEKWQQDFRYLREFGVQQVVIASSGTPFTLQQFVEPTDAEIDRSVANLINGIAIAKTVMGDNSPLVSHWGAQDMVNFIREFRGDQRHAMRRLDEIAYILHRYREIQSRFLDLPDTDADSIYNAYANQVRTRSEEIDFIFNRLLGGYRKEGKVLEDIELSSIIGSLAPGVLLNFEFDSEPQYTLVVAVDETVSILDKFCTTAMTHDYFKYRMPAFEMRVNTLIHTYYNQWKSYTEFRGGSVKPLQVPDGLLPKSRTAQAHRKNALQEYGNFRRLYDQNKGLGPFFYFMDPEGRAGRPTALQGSKPVHFMDAKHFYENQLRPIFKQIQEYMYRGVLLDVIIRAPADGYDNMENHARVLNHGRTLIVIVDATQSLMRIRQTVQRDCAHILLEKLGLHPFLEEFDKVNRNHIPASFFPTVLAKSLILDYAASHAGTMDRIMHAVYTSDHRHIVEFVSGIQRLRGDNTVNADIWIRNRVERLTEIEFQEMEDIRRVYDSLVRRAEYEKHLSNSAFFSGGLPHFSSFRATQSLLDDAIEIIYQLHDESLQAMLIASRMKDDVIMGKIKVFLRLCGASNPLKGEDRFDVSDRVGRMDELTSDLTRLIHSDFRVERHRKIFWQGDPLLVMVVTTYQDDSISSLAKIKEAEDFVAMSIRTSKRRVTFLNLFNNFVTRQFEVDYKIVASVEDTFVSNEAYLFASNRFSQQEISDELNHVLQRNNINLHGQRLKYGQVHEFVEPKQCETLTLT